MKCTAQYSKGKLQACVSDSIIRPSFVAAYKLTQIHHSQQVQRKTGQEKCGNQQHLTCQLTHDVNHFLFLLEGWNGKCPTNCHELGTGHAKEKPAEHEHIFKK